MIPYILIVLAAALWFWPDIADILPNPKPAPQPEPTKKPARKKKEPARNERKS